MATKYTLVGKVR